MIWLERAAGAWRRRPFLFIAIGWAFSAFALFFVARLPGFFEPDRLFHLSLFREMGRQGSWALRTWAQYPFLGWDQYFSDKEFLFHFLGYPAWRLGGEAGFLALVAFFSAAILWLPLCFLKSGRAKMLLAGVAVLFLNPSFLYRLNLARPHVLAVALFTGFIWSLLARRSRSAVLFGLGFALAYHAFYLPLFLALLVAADARLRLRERAGLITGLAGAAGILAGLIVNPYFPSNIVRGLQHLAIAINGRHLPDYVISRLGSELGRMDPWAFLKLFLPMMLAFLMAAYLLRRRERRALPFIFVGALLWAAAWFSPRTLEFVAPLTVQALGLAWRLEQKRAGLLIGVVALANAGVLYQDGGFLRVFNEQMIPADRFEEILKAIPAQSATKLVFHDRWDHAPYITYHRADLAAVEVLDPTYLWLRDPRLSEFLTALGEGKVEKSAEAIREIFHAEYVIASPRLARRLEKDAKAERLLVTKNNQIALFRLKP